MAKRGRPPKADKAGKKPDASSGHKSSVLTDDERQALHFKHVNEYEIALAAKKKADADLKNCGKRIKAEGDTVDAVKISIALKTPEGEAAFKARMQRDIEVAVWNGVGVQIDLFGEADRTPAVDRAFEDGKRSGMKGDPRKPPHDPSTAQYGAWMDGYQVGNEALAKKGFKAPATVPDQSEDEPPKGMSRKEGLNLGTAAPTHEVVQ